MAHDPLFEQRIAEALKAQGMRPGQMKMFGGVAFMVNGWSSGEPFTPSCVQPSGPGGGGVYLCTSPGTPQ